MTFAVAFSLSVLVPILVAVPLHLSRSGPGLSNRGAAMQSFLLLIALTASATSFVGLRVDLDHVLTDMKGVDWCWVGHDEIADLAARRAVRQGMYAGVCAIIGVEVVW